MQVWIIDLIGTWLKSPRKSILFKHYKRLGRLEKLATRSFGMNRDVKIGISEREAIHDYDLKLRFDRGEDSEGHAEGQKAADHERKRLKKEGKAKN